MSEFRISLAGDLGSGKSTIGKMLAEKHGAEIISVGKIQRSMAAEKGMTTCQFNQFMESHPEYDKILDDKLRAYDKVNGSFIFDSRMAWHFVPSAFSVYMKVEIEESAKRIIEAHREDEMYSSPEEAVVKLRERRTSEKSRYQAFYGEDITDMNNYDYVIDTSSLSPAEVAEKISEAYKKYTENK